MWDKVTIVGVGLLGGSIGLALKRRGLVRSVTGLVRRPASVERCLELGVVDEATLDPCRAAQDAELIVVCTPIAQMRPVVDQMKGALKKGVLVTDVGSVKRRVVEDLTPLLGGVGGFFVGSHPMAGGERTGPDAARADLFEGTVCVLTPTESTSSAATGAVQELWTVIGCRTIHLAPEEHDLFVSRTSHLPHIVAAQLAHLVLDPRAPETQTLLCANGFRDTTRIASGSSEMWRDIAWANRDQLGPVLEQFLQGLHQFRAALDEGDHQSIERFFSEAKLRRDAWSKESPALRRDLTVPSRGD